MLKTGGIIRIYHEGGIEKSVPWITDWHHEACRVLRRDGFFYPILTRIMDSFSYSQLNTSFILEKLKIPENCEYADMRHGDIILTLH